MRYAQIDENGICFADSYLYGEINADDMILLKENDISPLGKKYNNGKWQEMEQPQQIQQQSDAEMIMQTITDLELANIEAQQQRQILAQQMTDLELMILQGGNSNV